MDLRCVPIALLRLEGLEPGEIRRRASPAPPVLLLRSERAASLDWGLGIHRKAEGDRGRLYGRLRPLSRNHGTMAQAKTPEERKDVIESAKTVRAPK